MIAQIPIVENIGSDYDSQFMLHVHFVTSRAHLWCFDSRTGWKIDLPSRFTLPLGNTSKVSAVENWFQNQHLHPENVQTSPKFLPAEISSTARLDEANSCGPCSSWVYINWFEALLKHVSRGKFGRPFTQNSTNWVCLEWNIPSGYLT